MSSAFRLDFAGEGLATLVFDLPDRSANVFNRAVMEELGLVIDELGGRDDVRCLVLLSGKERIFIAGADIEEISRITDAAEAEEAGRAGQRVFAAWEALPFATVAAVRGTCVGGGTELALACDYIVISDRSDIRIGLPEVQLGIVPGWGGCTRLPQRVGIAAALDIILAGKTVRPKKALKIGLADALLPDATFAREVRTFAGKVAGKKRRQDSRNDLKTLLLEKNPLGRKVVFDQARKQVMAKTAGKYPAPLRALEVVRVGVSQGAAAGFEAEARALGELAVSPVARNLVHVFGLIEAAKRADRDSGERSRPVRATAVLGAGAMGGGIAQIIADKADLPVRMKDIGNEQLAHGMATAAALFGKQLRRRWLSKPEAARKMTLLQPTLEYSGFAGVDLVVEAVVERLDIKQQVFADVEERVSEDAVLASNTSSISIDLIAAKARHPERFVGMHFFNPVHKMPLVEVIRGTRTSDEATATVIAFSRRLGKTPIVVKDGPGFLVNRLLTFNLAEAMWLLDEGYAIEDLDRVMKEWGLPVGPIELTDEVGIDVAVKVGHIIGEAYSDRLAFPAWFDKIVEAGRLGAKTQSGFYSYSGGKRQKPDPEAYRLLGLEPRVSSPDANLIADRTLLPMVNEAARCLAEGVVGSAGELDLSLIMGTGFPPFRGGLCRWADDQGTDRLLKAMQGLASRVGERYRPSPEIEKVASGGGFYAVYP